MNNKKQCSWEQSEFVNEVEVYAEQNNVLSSDFYSEMVKGWFLCSL